MPDPIDYISPLGRFADAGQLMQAMKLGDEQIATERAQQETYRAQGAAQALKAQRQAAYQQAVSQVLLNPTDKAGYRRLLVEFPEFSESIKAAHNSLDEDQKRTDLSQATDVAALALAGNYKGAADSLRRRVDADRAAGRADPQDEALLAELESTDPTRQKAAAGLAAAHVAAIGGIEHFSGILASLKPKEKGPDIRNVGAGDDVISVDPETGEAKTIYRSPYLKGPDGQLYEREGGDPGLAGGGSFASTVHPAAASVAQALSVGGLPAAVVSGFMGNFHVEGGYDGAKGDGGSASGIAQWRNERADNFRRVIGKDVTEATPAEQARFVLWEMQNPQAAGMTVKQRDAIMAAKTPAQAAALIDQYYERSSGRDRKGRIEAANAFAGQFSPGGGSTETLRPVFPEKVEPKTRLMTPAEIAAVPGLDPGKAYQISPEGTISAIGGSDRGQLKPWPAAALSARSSNNAALTNIGGVLNLLNPKNQSKEARIARSAIGFGTGMLGDRYTQWNNPEGTDARARIGQIGGLIIKDTSGAAVSLAEDQRLAKWVPLVTDEPEVAYSKLRNLQRELKQRNQAMDDTYSEDQGYRPFKSGEKAPAAAAPKGWGKARRVN